VVRDTAEPIARFALGDDAVWYLDPRFVLAAITLLFILPLSYLKKISALQYTSIVALISLLYLAVLVSARSIEGMLSGTTAPFTRGRDVVWFNADVELFYAVPLITLAFTFHMNIAPIYEELRDPTVGIRAGFRRVISCESC
jgi:amino acid permease